MIKKVLVTGADGMVGSRFVELYSDQFDLILPSEKELDITEKRVVDRYVRDYKPDVIINFAAFTNVNEAEKQRGDKEALCWEVNVEGVRNLVDSIGKSDILFIQISTDMVFSGAEDDPGPHSEYALPEQNLDNLTWYGYTKSEADRYVRDELNDKYSIVRIMYPVRAKFDKKLDPIIRKPLELYDQRRLYPLINNQQITISFIDEIADALSKIIKERIYGTLHISSINTGTPYEIISYMLKQVRGVNAEVLKQTTLENYLKSSGHPSHRYPKYGGLKTDKTQETLGMKFITWQQIINELVRQGLGS